MSENSEQYFFNFSFFKVDPKWRWMADLAKEESAKEVENIITARWGYFGCQTIRNKLTSLLLKLKKPARNQACYHKSFFRTNPT